MGLGMASFLILSAITGIFISFEHEVDALLNPSLFYVDSLEQAVLPLESLVAKVEAKFPMATVRSVVLPKNQKEVALIRLRSRNDQYKLDINEVFVNPYNGEVLGARLRKQMRFDRVHIVPMLREIHESLYLDNVGEWLLGIVAFIWFISGLVGVYLTLPRTQPFFSKWRKSWTISPKRLNFDLHRAGGLWFLALLLTTSVSGIYLTVGKETIRPLVAQFAILTPPPGKSLRQVPVNSLTTRLSFDDAKRIAITYMPQKASQYRAIEVRYMASQQMFRTKFMDMSSNNWLRMPEERMYIDANSGKKIAQYGFLQGSIADKLLFLQLPLHSGKILGSIGQGIMLVFGIMTLLISVTGIIIWWKKHSSRSSKSTRG
jgi:uncharacterized iron-regulated membrane protein